MQKMLTKRLLTIIMSFIMVISMLPGIPVTTVLADDGSQSTSYYIRNNYKTNCYLYEDNGTLRFGQPLTNTDLRYQWDIEEVGNYKALRNEATNHYINVSGCAISWDGSVNVSEFADADNDFLWSFDTASGTYITSASHPGANISMATSESFSDRTLVECRDDDAAAWGTSKWDFIKTSDFITPITKTPYYIQNNYIAGSYLYDDQGTLKFGQPLTNTDLRYQWDVEEVGSYKALKNQATNHYINVSGCAISWDGSVNVSEFADADNDFLWNFDTASGTYITSAGHPGANISMATSESFSDRTLVECRDDDAAAWGTSKWDFIKASDFAAPESKVYVNIQNSYYQLYLLEDNGTVIYGNTKRSNEYAQWLVTKDSNGLYAIQNKATGHYILPVAASDKLTCADSFSPYCWTKEAGSSGTVFGDYAANAGLSSDETYIHCIHMENKKGYAENSSIQKTWGTPQWILKEYTETGYTLIKSKDTNQYLYEDSNNFIQLGTFHQEDTSFYWSVETSGGITHIVNRKTAHNISIENIYKNNDSTLPVEGMTGEPSWSSTKWSLSEVTGEPDTYIIESAWDWYKDFLLNHKTVDDTGIYCNKDASKTDTNAWWVFETAPDYTPPVLVPQDYIRLKSSASDNSLYEIQKSHALVYGAIPEDDLRGWWLIEPSESGNFYTLKNKVSGRYITADDAVTYIKCVDGTVLTDKSYWEISNSEGSENLVLRNKAYPLTYLNIGAGAGYAQSTLVSTEAGTTQWVTRETPAEGINPENGSTEEVTTALIEDTNKYYAAFHNNFLTIQQGKISESALTDENSVWAVQYYDGKAALYNKINGQYLCSKDGSLTLKACAAPEDISQVLWEKSEINGALVLTREGFTLTLSKAKDTSVYKASEAFTGGDATVFTVYSDNTGANTVTLSYSSTQAAKYEVKVNGIGSGTLQFVNTSGVMKSKTMSLTFNKGINTITLRAKENSVTLDKLQFNSLHTDYRGATENYTQYEAEDNSTNATLLADSRKYRDIASEASGRQAVELDSTGDYLEFTLKEAANSLVLRYCIPDSPEGGGINASLSLYADGEKQQTLALTSANSWVYGSYPWTNTPDDKPHRFFDDSRFLLDKIYPAGTTIRLQKDASDTAGYYILDLAETELAAPKLTQPADSLSITAFGAAANDGNDDTAALLACITAASAAGKEVWIPAGTFDFNGSTSLPVSAKGITLRGSGMWYTTLQGSGAGFLIKANDVSFYDFSILGAETGRNDAEGRTAFEVSDKDGDLQNLTIQNIWMEHTKTGIWTYYMDHMHVAGCRIRNTYADGINLCGGTSNSLIEQCQIRNTGDDAIALWSSASYGRYDTNNTIRFNTAGLQWLASNVAIYGGKDNTVTDNILHDTVAFGGGINISANHNPVGFGGTVTAERNTLLRCGGHEYNYNQDYGAVWIYPVADMGADIILNNNEILDSTYQGLSIIGGHNIKSLSLFGNIIDTCGTWGMDIASGNSGTMNSVNSVIRGDMINSINNGSSAFTLNDSVNNQLAPVIKALGIISAANDGYNGFLTESTPAGSQNTPSPSAPEEEDPKTETPKETVSLKETLKSKVAISKTTGSLSLTIPVKDILEQAKDGNPVDLSLTIASGNLLSAMNSKKLTTVNITVQADSALFRNKNINFEALLLPKEILSAAKKSKTNLVISVKDENNQVITAFTFDGKLLGKSKKEMKDTNLLVDTEGIKALSADDPLSKLLQSQKSTNGILLDFKQNGAFAVSAKVKLKVLTESGLKKGNTLYLYSYSSKKNSLTPLSAAQYKVDKNGYVTITISTGGTYVLLLSKPKK